jgi:hypothetical protein
VCATEHYTGRGRETNMSDAKVHTGGCHCGRVRYQVAVELANVVACNCSICTKRGALWAFTGADQFKLQSGADDLTDYQFNKHVIHHLFCRHCGVGAFSRGKTPDGRDTVAVNVRCLDEADTDTLKVIPFEGRKL